MSRCVYICVRFPGVCPCPTHMGNILFISKTCVLLGNMFFFFSQKCLNKMKGENSSYRWINSALFLSLFHISCFLVHCDIIHDFVLFVCLFWPIVTSGSFFLTLQAQFLHTFNEESYFFHVWGNAPWARRVYNHHVLWLNNQTRSPGEIN